MYEITDFVESHQTEEGEKEWEVRDREREIAYEKKKLEKLKRKAAEKAKKEEEDKIAEAKKKHDEHKKAKADKKAEDDKKCFVEDKHGLCLAT